MRSQAVAFDVTPLAGFRTGIGLAVQETYEALAGEGGLVPYAIGLRARREGLPDGTRIARLPTRGLVAAWGRADQPRLDRLVRPARVLHGTNYLAPPSRLPTLVTVHDCAFALFPETVTPVVLGFARVLRRAVARGAWVHCTTETVADEVEELLGPGLRRAGRIAVVPFGVPRLDASEPLPVGLAARLGGTPYVLALGTLEPRKNLARLARAFGRIAAGHPDLRLILAGPDGPGRPAVDDAVASLDPDARGRVVLAGAVRPGARRTLIEGAEVLAYPSLYEGFGFPMLEAMTLGVPVVTSDVSSLPEVAGDAAHLVDPLDPDAIADGLQRVLDDEAQRHQLIERGKRRAALFTWERTAAGLRGAYSALAGSDARTSS